VEAIITAENITSGYHGHAVVEDVSLVVAPGQVVALLGANGAGKTTTLLSLAGEIPLFGGKVRFRGTLQGEPLHQRARKGMAYVLEERSVFTKLTVAENLRVARCDTSHALELFPELDRLMNRRAGLLSGGEQQMLSVAAALARHPKLLMVDELSLGLAPLIVGRLMRALRTAADNGVGVLVVEQHVKEALAIADFAYVLRRGRVTLEGTADDISSRLAEVESSYL
jgi:branched-chain amino acid transport system ATP-binding protein